MAVKGNETTSCRAGTSLDKKCTRSAKERKSTGDQKVRGTDSGTYFAVTGRLTIPNYSQTKCRNWPSMATT
eukprot:491303-Amphidinium_carterae.1